MVKISNAGYILRKNRYNEVLGSSIFLVKCNNDNGTSGYITLHRHPIYFPKRYIGKRIRIKIEEVD